MRRLMASMFFASICAIVTTVQADPVVPQSDDEVIETLPAAASRGKDRQLRRLWAAEPRNAGVAVALSARLLQQARSEGDPRYAGQALAVLQAWPDLSAAPGDVVLMVANVRQYLHEFDAAAALLTSLVQRQPRHAQAWLTLATVRRVQGRYSESDAACRGLASAGGGVYAQACQAENDGLRGNVELARASLRRALAAPGLTAESRSWLLTTLAELEARAGRTAEAQAAYVAALAAQADAYTTLSYADFLIQQGRDKDALAQLKTQPRTDAVLLRLAIAGIRSKSPDAQRDAQEMRERMALSNLRPDARTAHAREQAMFALWVDAKPQQALELARANVRRQREPLDVLVLAEAARATGQADAVREADALRKEMGLHDQRLDSLL